MRQEAQVDPGSSGGYRLDGISLPDHETWQGWVVKYWEKLSGG